MIGLETSRWSRTKRLVLGLAVLFIVNIIWVASSELTEFIFKDMEFSKPYFTTYLKTSLFAIYLVGFLFWRPWRIQCSREMCVATEEGEDLSSSLGEPMYVPIKYDGGRSSGTESDDSSAALGRKKSVRFSQLSEIRHLSESTESKLSRLSYVAYLKAQEAQQHLVNKLSIKQVLKISAIFCILWFFANYSYQSALKFTKPSIVNILSSTSSIFTLILAALVPSSNSNDKFTLSKLVVVLISMGGVIMVCFGDATLEDLRTIPTGALWALGSALLYAIYLVTLRRKVDSEDCMDIPMFFGFVGLLNVLLLWPGFFILDSSGGESFKWPSKLQWLYIVLNGVIGTVLSELLWLWGCFLTSSLVATLAMSLSLPMTMIADILIFGKTYNWLVYAGSGPVFLSFFAVSLLTHWENWDPVLLCIKKIIHCICQCDRRRTLARLRDIDREQTETLINGPSDLKTSKIDT